MNRHFISALVFAAAPLSLAGAEPAPAPQSAQPATCPQMQLSGGHGGMQQHTGGGTTDGSGHMMQHEAAGMGADHMGHGSMGNGTMEPGNMEGHSMQHGDHAGMGSGNHQGMMQGQGSCAAASQSQVDPTKNGK